MQAGHRIPVRERALSALAAFAIVAAGVAVLLVGLAGRAGAPLRSPDLAAVFTRRVEPPPPPRPPERPARADDTATKGRPSPRNLRNKASEVFAPLLPPLIVPPPLIAAPHPAIGSAPQSGASDRLGPGRGAGGIGDGNGGGGDGNGMGEGDEDGVTRPRQIRGKLRYADLPPDLREAHSGAELEVTYRIGLDGRVSDCRVTQSSGRPSLDRTTCRLITERFRFRPQLDRYGRPQVSYMVERHGWFQDPAADLEAVAAP